MTTAIFLLIGSQLAGEVLRQALHLPLPDPVIGMFLLAVILVARGFDRLPAQQAASHPLTRTAKALIADMGLLFIPAGVGIVTQTNLLRSDWLPILAGLFVSTVSSLIITGLVMHHVSRLVESRRGKPPLRHTRTSEVHP